MFDCFLFVFVFLLMNTDISQSIGLLIKMIICLSLLSHLDTLLYTQKTNPITNVKVYIPYVKVYIGYVKAYIGYGVSFLCVGAYSRYFH